MDELTTTSALVVRSNSGSWRAGVHWRRMQPARWPFLTLASSFAFVLCFLCPVVQGRAQTQIIQPMASTPRAGEVDTADRSGQAGGKSLGINYQLSALRCGTGQAIVGANLRRGDVLDFLQVACATPVCNGGNCQWSAAQWGPSGGNPSGGDAHPPMMCAQNQAVSGFRGRVVSFFTRRFDFAEDIEIECSQIVAAPTAQGYVQVSSGATQNSSSAQSGAATWHHPEGGLSLDTIIPRWRTNATTPIISCARRGWAATAFSLGISDFVSSRVIQAVSLYCPAGRPSAPSTVINQCVKMQTDALHLLVDSQLSGVSQRSYNCFHYVRTFIERSPPSSIFTMWWDIPNSSEIEGPNWPQNFHYLEDKGYQELATNQSLQNFQAQVGDIVTVESPPNEQQGFPYLHGAVVVEVSASGQIVRLRQKTNVQDCVRDLDPVTFMTKYYGVPTGYYYELWRNPQRQDLPRAN